MKNHIHSLLKHRDEVELNFFCFIFMMGFSYLFSLALSLEKYRVFYIGVCLLFAFVFYSLLNKKIRNILYILLGVIVFLGVFLIGIRPLFDGFIQVINQYILAYNEAYIDGLNGFRVTYESELCCLLASFFILMFVYRLFHYLFIKTAMVPLILFMVCIMGLHFYLHIYSLIGYVLLLVSFFSAWIIWLKAGCTHTRALWLIIVFALLFLTVFEKNDRLLFIDHFRENIEDTMEHLRYGKDDLPHGNLYDSSSLLNNKNNTLLVKSQQIKSLYLKGFVGSSYNHGVWEELSKREYGYENEGMLDWVDEHHFTALGSLGNYNEIDNQDLHANTLTIENNGADRRYAYIPNSVVSLSQSRLLTNKDYNVGSLSFFGTKNYEIEEVSTANPSELLIASSWVHSPTNEEEKEYAQAESVYRQFVYEHYVDVDVSLKEVIDTYFKNQYKGQNYSFFSITSFIRNQLSHNILYSKTNDLSRDKDPLISFLTESKKGNSVLFASTAVEAYRSFGIPARYVEGYYVSEGRIRESKDGRVQLTNQDGHAWVEVYMDGMGWLSVDVTPGYYYDNATLMKLVEKPNGQTTKVMEDNQYGDEATKANSSKKANSFLDDLLSIDHLPQLIILFVLIFVFVGIILILIQEMIRSFYVIHTQKRYKRLNNEQKTRFLYAQLHKTLDVLSIPSSLGWNVTETDEMINERFSQFNKGEYKRVNSLFEKYYYGDEILQVHEITFIENYIQRFSSFIPQMTYRQRLKFLHIRISKKEYI